MNPLNPQLQYDAMSIVVKQGLLQTREVVANARLTCKELKSALDESQTDWRAKFPCDFKDRFPSLQSLSCVGNGISEDDLPELTEGICHVPGQRLRNVVDLRCLVSLRLEWLVSVTSQDLKLLGELPRLSKLQLIQLHGLDDQSTDVIGALSQLNSLTVRKCINVSTSGILKLMRLPNLRDFEVIAKQPSELPDECIELLENQPQKFQNLQLHCLHYDSEFFGKYLSNSTSLTFHDSSESFLDKRHNQSNLAKPVIQQNQRQALLELRNIQHLKFGLMRDQSFGYYPGLNIYLLSKKLTNLSSLDLRNLSCSLHDYTCLSEIPQLQTLKIPHLPMGEETQIFERIATMSHLTQLVGTDLLRRGVFRHLHKLSQLEVLKSTEILTFSTSSVNSDFKAISPPESPESSDLKRLAIKFKWDRWVEDRHIKMNFFPFINFPQTLHVLPKLQRLDIYHCALTRKEVDSFRGIGDVAVNFINCSSRSKMV